MNYYMKLYIVEKNKKEGILLYGYGLFDTALARGWSSGQIDKKLKLYKFTCVMDEAACLDFQTEITKGEKIELTNGFFVKMNLKRRPSVTYIPNRESGNGIVKSLSYVDEFWNLEKEEILDGLKELYSNRSLRMQREMINHLLQKLSLDTTLPFLNDSAKKLGNIEIYRESVWNDYFSYEVDRKDNEDIKSGVYGVILKKKKPVEFELLVHCELKNAGRYVLNQIKEMNRQEQEIHFQSKEVISHIYIEIWNKETQELIYASGKSLMRQMILSIGITEARNVSIQDPWVMQLEKTFSVNKEKIEQIKTVSYEGGREITKIGEFKNDPWKPAGDRAIDVVRSYRLKKSKGAFCRKTDSGDGEIDSFITIADYLNEKGVNDVIIVDPYFSIMAMQKFLGRIKNQSLRLEIITSLKDIDPDKDAETESCYDAGYLDKVRSFLENNNHIIHRRLKISNITHQGNVAIHDRYLLRCFADGSVDGYLLSNSLNSAGKNYSFVVAKMDDEVVYEVLEYVSQIQDVNLQKNLPEMKRLEVEVLWDTLDRQVKTGEKDSIPKKQWEIELKAIYEEKKKLEVSDFGQGPFWGKEHKKQYIQKICWAIYHDYMDMKREESIALFEHAGMDRNELLLLCKEIAVELEQEEELCEKKIPLNRRNFNNTFRRALNPALQKEVAIYPKYLLRDGLYGCYYHHNNYLSVIYDIVDMLDPCELISVMIEAHSPKALEHLWFKLTFAAECFMDLYQKMLASEIEWLQRLAYCYITARLLGGIENKEEMQLLEIFKSGDWDAFQYADCLNEITFKMDQIERRRNDKLNVYEKLKELREETLNILADKGKKGQVTDTKRFMGILRGPNDKWYSKNLTDLALKSEEGIAFNESLLTEIISLLQKKWEKKDTHFHESDYEITGNAAYASFVCWGSDINEVSKHLKINDRDLYQALEPGIKDRHYTVWNQAVQKVLWQILFLKDYLIVLKENDVEDKYIVQVEVRMKQLGKIKSQCVDENDFTGLWFVMMEK